MNPPIIRMSPKAFKDLKQRRKICLFCKYFVMHEGWAGSEYTPGDEPSVYCAGKESYFIYSGDFANEFQKKNWREIMLTAETCEFYEEEDND